MPFEPDPYRTLGLTRGASLDEVKRAYRRLAKANHPDAAGPAALSRFLAIQAAYDALTGGSGTREGERSGPAARPRPSSADPDRTEATRRAHKARSRARASGTQPGTGATEPGTRNDDPPRSRAARGKATLGSTSYDGADAGPFEPDWGGASWYGTTSGTYWTINPKEYADPRKHGPEYQARARRATGAHGVPPGASPEGGPDPAAPPTHTTASWWASTSGPQDGAAGEPDPGADVDDRRRRDRVRRPSRGGEPAREEPPREQPPRDQPPRDQPPRDQPPRDQPAPDPTRAAIDLGRALTDPRSGGFRGRLVRAVLGWLPIALGIGWLVGELTGCGRFAATCDPSVMPLTAAGQAIALVALLIVPDVAAITAGAALFLLVAALGASLILSATGAAADEGSGRAALGTLLVVAWASGLAIAVVRRFRSGSRSSRPVS